MALSLTVNEFRDLTRNIVQSSDPRVKLALARLELAASERALCASIENLEHFRQVSASLRRLRGGANVALRASCIRACCQYLFLTGHSSEALELARHGLELIRRTTSKSELRFFHTLVGILFGEVGDQPEALKHLNAALILAIDLGDVPAEIVVWNNVAAQLLHSGLYVESISASNRCIELLDEQPAVANEQLARSETNLGLAFHRLGELDIALEHAKKSIADSGEPTNGREAQWRINREANLVAILIEIGDIQEARHHAALATELAARHSNDRSHAAAEICEAHVTVFDGDSRSAILRLEGLAASKVVQSMPPLHLDTICALSSAYQACGRHQDALNCIERLTHEYSDARVESALREFGVRHFGRHAGSTSGPNGRGYELKAAKLKKNVVEDELSRSRLEMLERMAVAADIREDISGEHGYRVGRLSALLAREIGWDRDACQALDIAARLHDIGKIGIPERILLDEKILKEAERHFIAAHTLVGAEILAKSEIPQVRIAEEIARCHHERWDGAGYPKGLKGQDIPKGARIVTLADVFDAMTHGRPYAAAISVERALDEIAAERGRQFDPELTDHFLALVRRLSKDNPDLDAFLGKAARHSPFLKARARIKELLAQSAEGALGRTGRPPGAMLN